MLLALLMGAHFLGLVFWFGGGLCAAATALFADGRRNFDKDLNAAAAHIFRRAAWPGALLSAASGAVLTIINAQYFTVQGWFRLKLMIFLAALALTAGLAAKLKSGDEELDYPGIRSRAKWLSLLGALMLLLSTVRPF